MRTEQRKYEPDSDEEEFAEDPRRYFKSPQVKREYGGFNSAQRRNELDLF